MSDIIHYWKNGDVVLLCGAEQGRGHVGEAWVNCPTCLMILEDIDTTINGESDMKPRGIMGSEELDAKPTKERNEAIDIGPEELTVKRLRDICDEWLCEPDNFGDERVVMMEISENNSIAIRHINPIDMSGNGSSDMIICSGAFDD